MLVGIYAFFALYHGVLFALRPKDTGYLYFGASTLLLAAFMFSRTNAAASLIMDASTVQRIEDVSLFFSVPAIIAFIESMLRMKRSRFVAASAAFALALSIACLFLRSEPLVIIWFGSTVLSIAYLTVFTFGAALKRDLVDSRENVAPDGQRRSISDLAGGLFFKGDSALVALGTLALGAAVVVDVLASGIGDGAMPWSRYAFFLFMLFMSGMLAARFAQVSKRAEAMNSGLEAEVEAGTAALATATSERVRLNAEITAANALLSEAMSESARDVQIAAIVQKGFFPKSPPASPEWDIAYVFEPASGISGDFYDFYEKAGALTGLVAGTVSGSGVASGLVTVLAKNVFNRGMQEMDEDPTTATLVEINRRLVRELSVVGNTVSCTFMKLRDSRVEYVNAAHTDALIRRAGRREVSMIKFKDGQRKSPPLGRDDFESGVGALRFTMAPGDAALIYTAGLVGGANAKGLSFGVERLAESFGRADPENAESTLASVMIDFRNATAGASRSGDITAVVLVRR
jgi:sigma-B regulation protein RsbU (phosphoserine phosphatase)